jgi:hypothetical protein
MYLRDTLLCAAEAGLYQVRWTDEILAGAFRNLVKDGRINKIQADRLNQVMNQAFPEALIEMTDDLLPCMDNDEGDRHVLAAALVGKAEIIVTNNLKHFPQQSLEKFNVIAYDADDFLLSLLDLFGDRLISVLETQASRTQKPNLAVSDLLNFLNNSVPNFSSACLGRIFKDS